MDRNWRERDGLKVSKKTVRDIGLVEIRGIPGIIIGSPRRMRDGYELPLLAACPNQANRSRGSIKVRLNGQIIRNIQLHA